MANLLSTNVSGRLYVSTQSDVNSTGGAFRFYDGTTFRGGLGLDDWAHGGSAANITMYVNGDNNFFISTSGVKRAQFNSGAAIFRTYSADTNYNIRITGGDQFNAYYGDNATTMYVNWNGGTTRFGGEGRFNSSLYSSGYVWAENAAIRIGEIWGYGGLYRSSGSIVIGVEGSAGWSFRAGNTEKVWIGNDGNIYMAWAGAYISTLLDAKQNASTAITTSNIGSQSVSYATNSGSLDGYDYSQFTGVLARYITTAGGSARIRITAPFNTNSSKMFSVDINMYAGYTQYKYTVSGYMYGSINQWYDPKAVFTGTGTPDIYVGRDNSGRAYISIANGNYTGIVVNNFVSGYVASEADAYIPWSITLDSGNENSVVVGVVTTITSANIASQSVSYAVTSGTSSATTQTNFSELSIGGLGVATREYVTSQGYLTSLPSHNHDDRYYTESESDGRYVPYGSIAGSFGLNDNKLYLRTNGDNNHYLWNAADDWEELVYYTGTGFRVKGSTGTVSATFTDSGINLPSGSVAQFYTAAGSLRGYIQATDTDDNHFIIATSGGEDIVFKDGGLAGERNMVIRGNASVEAYGDFRAPIFYDSADTGYYLDPNGSSNLLTVTINNNYVANAIYFGGGNNYLNWTDSRIYSNVAIQGAEVYTAGWFRANGHQGLYNPTNNAHFYPNNASYGSWRIDGSRNGWHGLHFDSGSTLMMNSAETGVHREGYGWQFRWYNGSMFVSRGTYGGGTEYTVIDSGTIGSQSVNYATSAGNADTVDSLHASSFVRNDTTGQYLRAYYQYGSYLTSERPIDLRNQMGGSGMRVDFMHPSYAGGGSWNHVITFSGYDAYNMYQLGGYYDGGSVTNLYVRSEANHGTTSWTAWRRLLNEVADPYAVNMNQYVRTTDGPTFAQVYSNGWFRTYSTNGLYNETYGNHWYATSNATWNAAGNNGSYVEIAMRTGGHQGPIRGYFYADSSANIGILNNAGNWSLLTNSSRNTTLYGQLTVGEGIGYSSIFMSDSDEGTREIHCNSNRIGFLNSSGSWGAWLYDSADWEAAGSVRAPIFYDSANTNRYLDLNSTAADAMVISGGIHISRDNVTGNGIILADDGDIVDLNDAYCSMRFSYGVRIFSANRGGTAVHTLHSDGNAYFNTSAQTPIFLVNSHSDNTKGYRIHNTSGSSVSAMFVNSSNQLVIAAGAVDQVNLNKKVYLNGVALGVNVAASATAGRIDASNDIVAYSSSDERLKHNIAPIENALDKVKSLTGVEFDWKPEYKHAHGYEGHDTGIIAQQVQDVMPSAVRTNDTGFLAVRYEKLIGLLIEGMKEQQEQIEELKAQLNGLTK